MTKITKTIEIQATPDQVYAFMLSDKMNEVWGQWIKGTWTTQGPIRVGSIAHWVAQPDFKIKGEWDEEVLELEPNKKMVLRTVPGSKMNLTTTGLFEPSAKGTNVTYIEEYQVPYSIIGKLYDKLSFRKDTEKFLEAMMANLKKAIEV
jgi:uncharacterized membrane protein